MMVFSNRFAHHTSALEK